MRSFIKKLYGFDHVTNGLVAVILFGWVMGTVSLGLIGYGFYQRMILGIESGFQFVVIGVVIAFVQMLLMKIIGGMIYRRSQRHQ